MPGDPDRETLGQRLQRELRRYRGRAGMTQRAVADAMDWSRSKVIRIESGTVAVSTNDLRALLAYYGVDDAGTVRDLIGIARDAKHKSSLNRYHDVAGPTEAAYFDQEASASVIRQYEPLLVPGLLQTEEYVRAVFAEARLREGEQLERMVQVRLERQEVLAQADPAEMFFILDEAVLRRQVGRRGTMPRQLDHLVDLGSRRNISIQIVPFSRGAYVGMDGPFVVLDFAHDDSLLYLEGRGNGTLIRDDVGEVGSYLDQFQQLQRKLATDPDHLDEVMARIAP